MGSIIRFDNVSKQYRLGLTRTSIPTMISDWIRSLNRGNSQNSRKEKFIWALKDVSFDMKRGESLALIGPNGAGKTTILKLLANITKPSNGHVSVNGQLSALIELGAGFHSDLTGRENIYLNGTILGLQRKEIDKRFNEIVEFSELENFIDTPVKRYSSGMTVRLGFSVAACIEPDILLVDEVLAVGDASFRHKCTERIQSLLNRGTSIIFVSHNLYLVKAICASAIYLRNGQVQTVGKTSDVIQAYERDIHKERAIKFKTDSDRKVTEPDTDLEITKVEVVENRRKGSSELRSDQPAKILIHYLANRDFGKVSVAAFIIRSDGLTCCMMRTSTDNVLISLPCGEGVISVTLSPLQLVGDMYYARASFLNESDSMVISSNVGRSNWFMVNGSTLSYEEKSGVFEPKIKWENIQSQVSNHKSMK